MSTAEVLKASEIAPGAYAENGSSFAEELSYDIYNLAAFDSHAVDVIEFNKVND